MKQAFACAVAAGLSLVGCAEAPPPAGPLGALPADPQAAEQVRAEARSRVLRVVDAEAAERRERVLRLRGEIRTRSWNLQYSWRASDEPAGGPRVLQVRAQGDLDIPSEYGRIARTCSCAVHLRRLDPERPPRRRESEPTLARYVGSGRGTVEAVIETTRWQPGRYDVVLIIDGREVVAREFEILPSGEIAES